jgi:hypothetical protein
MYQDIFTWKIDPHSNRKKSDAPFAWRFNVSSEFGATPVEN